MEPQSPIDAPRRHPFEIATGRRSTDGRLRAEIFSEEMVAVSLECADNHMATRLLTLEQARILRDSLGELIRVVEENARAAPAKAGDEPWSGVERRAQA